MNLEVLSSNESMTLCRAGANLALSRFRSLAHQAEGGDRKLSRLFIELADDVQGHLVEIHQLDGQGRLPEDLEEEAGQKVARGFLPSLSKSGDGVRLDRESGFYRVECILKELGAFYGTLVRQSCDEKSRELLLRLASAVRSRLEYLHHVVL